MQYQGSKKNGFNAIVPLMLGGNSVRPFVDIFCGGCNVITRVPSNRKRIGNDTNKYIIALYNALQRGWVPPISVSQGEYAAIKENKHQHPPEMVGLVGTATFGNRWFVGNIRADGYKSKLGVIRNNYTGHRKSVLADIPYLDGIEFVCGDYRDCPLPPDSIIYCDPPYADTANHYGIPFDHAAFWTWCETQHGNGHKVFVSEYNAPKNWHEVWERGRFGGNNGTPDIDRKIVSDKLFSLDEGDKRGLV